MPPTQEPDADGVNPGEETSKTPLQGPLDEFLESHAKLTDEDGNHSGTYVRDLEPVLGRWIEWMQTNREATHLEDLDSRELGEYAKHLAARAKRSEGGISRSTAWKYYDYVSAYLDYCSEWGHLPENPAQTAKPKSAMPDRPSSNSADQQFWSPEQRQTLCRYVDDRAHDAIDERGSDALAAVRDRALVYVLGFSGVRGAEILQPPGGADKMRTGLSWDDVDLEARTLSVLGKSRDDEQAPLTDAPVSALERWEAVLDPPSTSWPVFPTLHLPTLREAAEEQLRDQDANEAIVEAVTDLMGSALFDAYREHDLEPPAMTTAGARYLLKSLTEDAGVDCSDDPKDYLTLHGARRGAGEAYYQKAGHEAAQRALRHADPETTSRMYAHIEASELSEIGTEVFEDE